MKVYVLPADAYGCGHYRLIWPADVLQQAGHDVVILPPNEKSGFLATVSKTEHGNESLTSVQVPADADVIVLQRPAHQLQPQMVSMMRKNGIAVVVDMDDDMSSIHPENIAFRMYSHRSSTPLSWKWTEESCRLATFVTTTTPALQRRYAPHGRGAIIENYIPAACLEYEKPITGCFGWAGTTKSHPNDLQVTGHAVQDLVSEGFPFRVVGGKSSVKQCLKLADDPEVTGSIPLNKWVGTMALTYDVGMIPLAPTAFNASKSSLKGKEHMATGIPFVYSPREEYRRLHRASGCGLMAEKPKDWYAQIKRLMTDEVLWKEQSEAGKTYMQDQTYQKQAWRWIEAWEQAYKIQHGHGGNGRTAGT
jgi:hypothetical protein